MENTPSPAGEGGECQLKTLGEKIWKGGRELPENVKEKGERKNIKGSWKLKGKINAKWAKIKQKRLWGVNFGMSQEGKKKYYLQGGGI